MSTAVIIAGGAVPHPGVLAHLPEVRYVIAADGGLDRALALRLPVNELVGDLDSVSPVVLEAAREAGLPIHEHPRDKDLTDLELAFQRAALVGARRVLVLSGGGGRLDHELAMLATIARNGAQGLIGTARVVGLVAGRSTRITGRPGDYVSLVAMGGAATGITTTGLRFPLQDGTLEAGAGLGLSNELVGVEGGVSVGEGNLLVVQPGFLAEPDGTAR